MVRTREFYDADRHEEFGQPAKVMSQLNKHNVNCGLCGETYYLDSVGFERFNKSFEQSSENPFVCEKCDTDFEDLSHGSRQL